MRTLPNNFKSEAISPLSPSNKLMIIDHRKFWWFNSTRGRRDYCLLLMFDWKSAKKRLLSSSRILFLDFSQCDVKMTAINLKSCNTISYGANERTWFSAIFVEFWCSRWNMFIVCVDALIISSVSWATCQPEWLGRIKFTWNFHDLFNLRHKTCQSPTFSFNFNFTCCYRLKLLKSMQIKNFVLHTRV